MQILIQPSTNDALAYAQSMDLIGGRGLFVDGLSAFEFVIK